MFQYLIKKGSMSNYSFSISDDEKSGILDYIFERVSFPIEKDDFMKELCDKLTLSQEKSNEYLKQLMSLNIIVDLSLSPAINKVCLFFNDEIQKRVKENFEKQSKTLNCKTFPLNSQDIISQYTYKEIEDSISAFDFVVVIHSYFSPKLFYQLNKICIEYNKPLFISYLDGNEGIVVPLISPAKLGCYNDFELLRESSFHNLLDYQLMKEKIINEKNGFTEYNEIYLNTLLLNTILIIKGCLEKSQINLYGYSFDFERMVNTKTKLIRFPNCPSCQGDSNISHPFI
jgi:thiazole/oxazole-forming peptide maturase SagC family component